MVPFTGWGLLYVLVIYLGGIALMGRLPFVRALPFSSQMILVAIAHVVLSCINYFLAKYLNRHEVKHTVAGMRLEKIVFYVSLILGVPVLMMLYGELKD